MARHRMKLVDRSDGMVLEVEAGPDGAGFTARLRSNDYLDGMTAIGVSLTLGQLKRLIAFLRQAAVEAAPTEEK